MGTMETEGRGDWLSKPPTARFWLAVISIVVLVILGILLVNGINQEQQKLEESCRIRQEMINAGQMAPELGCKGR
ncbi:hypothetical protein [Nocardia sp. NPDC049149]|uniref:hypothetical protein n=1 Tax=Nocardia sp. NPDC049149 TaxID=3364315 RepID=UPI00371434BE